MKVHSEFHPYASDELPKVFGTKEVLIKCVIVKQATNKIDKKLGYPSPKSPFVLYKNLKFKATTMDDIHDKAYDIYIKEINKKFFKDGLIFMHFKLDNSEVTGLGYTDIAVFYEKLGKKKTKVKQN